MLKKSYQFLFLSLLLMLASMAVQAGTVAVEGLRVWSAPDHSRLVFDVDGPIKHKLFTLDNPQRIVIDFKGARLLGKLVKPSADDNFIKGVRHAPRNKKDFRVVLDLKDKVKPKSFVLQPNKQYGYRLVVDLHGKPAETVAKKSKPQKSTSQKNTKPKVAKSVHDQIQKRDVVIAIDAGHGGEDPGASGPRGTKEKTVVLAIAKKLAKLLNKEKGIKAILTRQGDYYIGLRKRMKIARKHKADLFVSIHADAFRDSRVKGASVYVLSSRGASSEAARWLADRENSADLVGGVKLEDKDDMLASVLLDLSQTATRQASMEVANKVYRHLKKNVKTHGRRVQKAGFVVLKSPDVPSLLVETAFISNPSEEKNLRKPAYQMKMARSIMQGIRSYFHESPPPGTWLASNMPKKHVISSGDTLSGIAHQYRVSLARLKKTNGIRNDRLRIGQVLTIPRS